MREGCGTMGGEECARRPQGSSPSHLFFSRSHRMRPVVAVSASTPHNGRLRARSASGKLRKRRRERNEGVGFLLESESESESVSHFFFFLPGKRGQRVLVRNQLILRRCRWS